MADIAFERRFEARAGEVEQVSPLIRRLVCNNPGPFTFLGTSTYVVGKGEVAVIDPGPEDETHLSTLLAALKGETVSHILITHTHRDHSPLASRLKVETGAPTYGFGPHGTGRPPRPMESGSVVLDSSGDLAFSPDERLAHGDVLSGKGWTIEAVHTPGHTSNHLCFALREERALFSGDHVMAWSTSVIAPPDGNMADYFASLRLLIEREDEVYWPGHGPQKHEPKPFVRAFLAHRQMREAAILRRVAEGDCKLPEIVANVYSGLDPALVPAAQLSALAHLEHLIEQGKVRTDGPATLGAEYRPA